MTCMTHLVQHFLYHTRVDSFQEGIVHEFLRQLKLWPIGRLVLTRRLLLVRVRTSQGQDPLNVRAQQTIYLHHAADEVVCDYPSVQCTLRRHLRKSVSEHHTVHVFNPVSRSSPFSPAGSDLQRHSFSHSHETQSHPSAGCSSARAHPHGAHRFSSPCQCRTVA